MTNSKKRTEIHFKKVFLPKYTFGTVKIVEGKQERELTNYEVFQSKINN